MRAPGFVAEVLAVHSPPRLQCAQPAFLQGPRRGRLAASGILAAGLVLPCRRLCRRAGAAARPLGGVPVFPGIAGGRKASAAASKAPPKPREEAPIANPQWEQVAEGALLLRGRRKPKAVLCFAGGALVGAAPQLTYGRFLKQLAGRGYWVLVAPYAAGLDYVAVADFLEARFERALARLDTSGAPIWGVGHSLGALAQVLVSSRHPAQQRRGQVLISYTRRGEEALPVVRTALAANPLLGPLLRTVDVGMASDLLVQGSDFLERALKGAGPRAASAAPGVKDAAALLKQMLPLIREVGVEQESFRPSAGKLASVVKEGYRERSTLLLRLADDGLDESPGMAAALAALPADRRANVSVRVLGGQHLVPLLPDEAPIVGRLGDAGSGEGGFAEAAGQLEAIVDAIEAHISASS